MCASPPSQLRWRNVQYLLRKKLTKMPESVADKPRRRKVVEARALGDREDDVADEQRDRRHGQELQAFDAARCGASRTSRCD